MKKTVNRSYKFRLMPTAEQVNTLVNWADAKRFIWNKAMGLADTRLMNGHWVPKYEEYNKMITLWKQADEWKFLKEPPKDILQYTIKDFRKAIDDWFDPKQKIKRKPRFKSKKDPFRSFRIPGSLVKMEGTNKVILPKMKEPISFRRHRRVSGKIKNVTLSCDGKRWYVSFSCEVETKTAEKFSNPEALDVGTVRFATKTDGNFIKAMDFDREVDKLIHYQKMMSRRVKGSVRWMKAKSKVRNIYAHIANKRLDYLQKESSKLANARFIAIEDLKIRNMTASAKGTIEDPGKMVKQKAGLNRAILTQGWSMFFLMLEYKLEANGGALVRVSPEYSSQECSVCHAISKENRESQSVFICKTCGNSMNADHNASLVLLSRGHRVYAQKQKAHDVLD